MSNLDEIISLQNQMMNAVSRTLSNFRKLGRANMTLAISKQRLKMLQETFYKCQELKSKINLLADDKAKATHTYFTNQCFIACEDCYFETVDFLAEKIASEESQVSAVATVNNSSGSSSLLPTIDLPTFDGSYDKWESFRNKFKSIIHDDHTLSNLKRLHYLCSCLKGDASHALHDINIIDSNFELAWNHLVSRYENKRKLITHHLQTLVNLPNVTTETSKDLRDLRDKTNKALHSLKNLGCSIDN